MPKTDVAVHEETKLPAAMVDLYGASAGAGLEEADQDSFAVPFLKILQALSPELDEGNGSYIADARKGQFINSVTQEIYDGEAGLVLVPCYFKRRFIQWAPRETGGGFRAAYTAAEAAGIPTQPDERGHPLMENGDLLQDTREHYCLQVHDDGGWEPVIIALTATQLKKSKRWNYVMQQFKMPDGRAYPTFARKYRVSRVPESNNEGSWYGWKMTPDSMVTEEPLFRAALDFAKAVGAGDVKAADPVESVEEDDTF